MTLKQSAFQTCPSESKSREQAKPNLSLSRRAPPNQSQPPSLTLPSRPHEQSNRNRRRRRDRVRLARHPDDLVNPHVRPGVPSSSLSSNSHSPQHLYPPHPEPLGGPGH